MVWSTYRFRKHTILQNGKKWPEKKCSRVPDWVRVGGGGGGVQSLFGQCPNVGASMQKGAPLRLKLSADRLGMLQKWICCCCVCLFLHQKKRHHQPLLGAQCSLGGLRGGQTGSQNTETDPILTHFCLLSVLLLKFWKWIFRSNAHSKDRQD